MSTVTDDDLNRIQAKLQELPPADWVREMIDHFYRTGCYRSEDLRRLLGNPNKPVEIGPNVGLSSYLSTGAEPAR